MPPKEAPFFVKPNKCQENPFAFVKLRQLCQTHRFTASDNTGDSNMTMSMKEEKRGAPETPHLERKLKSEKRFRSHHSSLSNLVQFDFSGGCDE